MKKGNEAAEEFQKFLDHRGVVVNFPLDALAHLGLGRAYALERNTVKFVPRMRISSRSGKTLILIFPFSSPRKPSTRSSISYEAA
jgi:hypothetical protein